MKVMCICDNEPDALDYGPEVFFGEVSLRPRKKFFKILGLPEVKQ